MWPPVVERPVVLQVPLGPLRAEEASTLVRGVLERGDGDTGDGVVAELVTRGGGNPLFLVELAGLAATCGSGSELPGSLRALIAARLDQLPRRSGPIIDNAAVLGNGDAIGSLERFAKELGQEFRRSDLDELAADGLVDIEGHWWRFRSAVVREVAYQTLTKRVRAQRHAGVAAVMAERGPRSTRSPTTPRRRPSWSASSARVDGVKSTIGGHAVAALLEAATAAVAHRAPRDRRSPRQPRPRSPSRRRPRRA